MLTLTSIYKYYSHFNYTETRGCKELAGFWWQKWLSRWLDLPVCCLSWAPSWCPMQESPSHHTTPCHPDSVHLKTTVKGRMEIFYLTTHSTHFYLRLYGVGHTGRKEKFYLTMHSTHFILRLYGVGHMVKYHSDSERENPLPPHGLLFPINSKGSFICTIPYTG